MRKTLIDKDLLLKLYIEQGKSTRQIADELGCNPERVRVNLHRFDIPVRTQSESLVKYSYNKNYFALPNVMNSYWAGFIAADGCICHMNSSIPSLRLHLHKKDTCQLINFKEDIKYDGPICNDEKSCVLQINSADRLSQNLEKHFSITQRKSLTLEPPKLEELTHIYSYIVGYIDGDGWIGYYPAKKCDIRLSICGTYSVLSWMNNISNQYGTIRKAENIYILHINGKKAFVFLQNLLSHIDENTLRVLDRKWSRVRCCQSSLCSS